MPPYRLSPREVRNQARGFAVNGLDRQAIFDQMIPRFRGRERDLAVIIASVMPTQVWKNWGWTYWTLLSVIVISLIAPLALPFYFQVNFYLICIGMLPLITANAFILYTTLNFNRDIIGNFYGWAIGNLGLVFIVFSEEFSSSLLIGITIWIAFGYIISLLVIRKMWGRFKYTATQSQNENGQIIAKGEVQFLN